MEQLGFKFGSGRGGRRKGAGRKPKDGRRNVDHCRRPVFTRRMPVHVTQRMARSSCNLRSRRSFRVLWSAICASQDRFGCRICEFTVMGDHIHLLVEADSSVALSRGMKGLAVRMARGLNAMMGRKGP